jgi:hypothetical protein
MHSIEDWTLSHWERTSAVQCCHNQPLIDKVIPIYFKPQNEGDQAGMSQILISDKARTKPSKPGLNRIQRDHESIAPNHRGLPYIAILIDLGIAKSEFEVQVDSSSDKDPCLHIYARGLDNTTYPFLKGRDDVIHILNNLYKRQSAPARRNLERQLENQVQFGKSSKPCHMNFK